MFFSPTSKALPCLERKTRKLPLFIAALHLMLPVACHLIISAGEEECLCWNVPSSISKCARGEVCRGARRGSGAGGAGTAPRGGRKKQLHGESLQQRDSRREWSMAEHRKYHRVNNIFGAREYFSGHNGASSGSPPAKKVREMAESPPRTPGQDRSERYSET